MGALLGLREEVHMEDAEARAWITASIRAMRGMRGAPVVLAASSRIRVVQEEEH